LVGLSCIILYPHLTGADIKNGYVMAMKDYLPVGLKGLLLVAFFAAYLSTISTQLNWGASYLVNDFYKRFIKPQASDKKLIAVSRITTMLIMSIALIATTFMESISGVWSFIIECGAGLGMVLILRWFWWRINAWSEITATVAPFIGFGISRYVFNLEFPDSFFTTVAFTTIAWLVITFLTKPTDSSQLQLFYHRVQPGGMWPLRFGAHNGPKNEFTFLFMAWLISILMTYSILFLIGKFILAEYEHAIIATFCAICSFIALKWMLKKTAIFN
jgi:Na+/proline symporter